MKSKDNYKVIGIMSGTSLDGIDIACCKFYSGKHWKFKIIKGVTLAYSAEWKSRLSAAHLLSGRDLAELHAAYGALIGQKCAKFIEMEKLKKIDAVASHGHTIFHQIEKRITVQLGNGNEIYAASKIPVICDFRSLDVALKGEGAPLVPMGDRLLFERYDVCLNLGGIANLSMEKKGKRIAFDICFANMGLNYLAAMAGKEFDRKGALAAGGSINESLFADLKRVYDKHRSQKPSLGREGFERDIQPLLDVSNIPTQDKLRTFCESVAGEISAALPSGKIKMLVTGGGAFNSFLMKTIAEKAGNTKIVLPSREIIKFKEALVFAFLGVLRLRGEVNVLKSVTRATADSCSGALIGWS